ncbi:hypothetical protein ES705_47743 [subsurface metagenome]
MNSASKNATATTPKNGYRFSRESLSPASPSQIGSCGICVGRLQMMWPMNTWADCERSVTNTVCRHGWKTTVTGVFHLSSLCMVASPTLSAENFGMKERWATLNVRLLLHASTPTGKKYALPKRLPVRDRLTCVTRRS